MQSDQKAFDNPFKLVTGIYMQVQHDPAIEIWELHAASRHPCPEQAGSSRHDVATKHTKEGSSNAALAGHESASGSDSDAATEQRGDGLSSGPDQADPQDAAAAPPVAEREDWMTKAMPRVKADAPEVDEAAEAPEQPKKVSPEST